MPGAVKKAGIVIFNDNAKWKLDKELDECGTLQKRRKSLAVQIKLLDSEINGRLEKILATVGRCRIADRGLEGEMLVFAEKAAALREEIRDGLC